MLPLVTIITPSYNQGKFIEQTILSVLNQDYPNLEYIVVDGGSTDETLAILGKYHDKLKYISEPDEGQSDAINKGFKTAKGEIVAWLNSDDTYEPGAIKTIVDYFIQNPEVCLVYGEGDIINKGGQKVKRFGATQKFDLWTLIHVWDYIMQPTTFFRLKALQDVGYLDKKLHWCMDWDLWIRLASKYEVGYLNKVLANSREYDDTKTSTGGIKRFRELVGLMRKYGGMKYPPGFFLYAGSTMVSLTEKIPMIHFFARSLAYIINKSVLRNLPVVHKDGWAGRKIRLAIPEFKREINIEGELLFDKLLPLIITVKNQQGIVYQEQLKKCGMFSIKFEVSNKPNTINFLTLSFNHVLVPSRLNKANKDKRKLSVIIKKIQ